MARVEDSHRPDTPGQAPTAPSDARGSQQESSRLQERQDAHKFRILCESAPLGIFECDRDAVLSFYNPQLLEILGIAADADVQQAWADAIHPDDLPGLVRNWQHTLRHGTQWQYDYRVQTPLRGLRWLRVLLTPIQSPSGGEPESFVGTVEDVTGKKLSERALLTEHYDLEVAAARRTHDLALANERLHHEAAGRKRSEESVRASEQRFRQLADNIDDIFWVVAADFSEILYVSPAITGIWGRSPESFYENPLSFLDDVHPGDRARVTESLAALTEGTYNGIFRIVRPDGEIRTLRVRAFPVRNAKGEIYRLAGLSQDITYAKQIEDELRTERRFLEHLLDVQEVERRLTAYEIHDGFVQTVVAALMHLEGLRGDPNVLATTQEKLEVPLKLLRDAIDEARHLISGLRPPIIDEQGLVAAVEYLINEAAAQPIQVSFRHHVTFTRLEPMLEATLFRIAQEALNNVFRHSQAKTAEITLSQTGDRLSLVIEDSGIGFSPRRATGRRFGLRGIRERALLFGGTATIHSSPGQGTRVSVEVPLKLPFGQPPKS